MTLAMEDHQHERPEREQGRGRPPRGGGPQDGPPHDEPVPGALGRAKDPLWWRLPHPTGQGEAGLLLKDSLRRDRLQRLFTERTRFAPDLDLAPVQSGLRGEPWRILVACAMLNQTSIRAARPVLKQVLAVWPTPAHAALAPLPKLRSIITPCGLQTVRAKRLIEMSMRFMTKGWDWARDLPGVGRYALDALRIFVDDDLTVEPDDKVLRMYVEMRRAELAL